MQSELADRTAMGLTRFQGRLGTSNSHMFSLQPTTAQDSACRDSLTSPTALLHWHGLCQ